MLHRSMYLSFALVVPVWMVDLELMVLNPVRLPLECRYSWMVQTHTPCLVQPISNLDQTCRRRRVLHLPRMIIPHPFVECNRIELAQCELEVPSEQVSTC